MTKQTQNPWQRVSRRRPCPVCGRPTWCVFVGPADAPTAVICPRTKSNRRIGESGFLHVLRDDGPTWAPWRRTITRAIRMLTDPPNDKVDLARLLTECQVATKPQSLGRLAEGLGLSVESLRRLSVGWSRRHSAWTFPMRNADGKVVGIRVRLPSGRKLAVRGGREGLFLPEGLQPSGGLLVCEGATDTAACLDWGFQVVGRPSCSGGVHHLVELVKRLAPTEVVIVADGDTPGQRGAERLAAVLAAYIPAVRVIVPPRGLKDARQWKQAGATAADVQAAIDAAPVRRLAVMCKAKGRCTDARRSETR